MVLCASLAYQATLFSCIGGSWGLLRPTPNFQGAMEFGLPG